MVKKTQAKKRVKEVQVGVISAVENDAHNSGPSEEVFESLDDNSFEPLAAANVVNYSGSREIETVGLEAIKVRLSRFQVSYKLFPLAS